MGSKFVVGELIDHMRASTLKWIVLLSTILIALIIGVQLIWLNRVYSFEQKTFNVNVVKSIRGFYEDLNLADSPAIHLENLVENPTPDIFLFKTLSVPDPDSAIFYLKQEFGDFELLTNTHIGFFSARKGRYISEDYISSVAPRYKLEKIDLPVYKRNFDYIILYFPHRDRYVLSQMNFWFISSAILILVLIILAVSLFFFYRQKFLAEIQKDFVNNFTHEFKTPLAVMKISSDVLMQDKITTQPDRLKKYAAIIQSQTEHLQNQVERLLRIAASDRREMPIALTRVPVTELVSQAIAKVQPLIEEKHADVEMKNETQPFELYADKQHLEIAVVNLLENALKYSAHPHVIVTTGRENGDYFISVKDNGVGIDRKFHKSLFKKFYRVPTGNVHDVKGFGLGLNIVKRIMDAHSGRIRVNSLPGIGTEFKLLLPANSNS